MDVILISALAEALKGHPHGAAIMVALLTAWWLASIVNGKMKGPPKSLAGKLLDTVSGNPREDAAGSVKMPGRRSRFVRTEAPVVHEDEEGRSPK